MGTFTWPLRITGLDGGRSVDVEATVDTGAMYTMLPARTLRDLGVEPIGSRTSPHRRRQQRGNGGRGGAGHN